MSRILCGFLLLCLVALPGCTDRQIYSAIQNNQGNGCSTLPEPQINQCLERAGVTYDQYEHTRNESIGK